MFLGWWYPFSLKIYDAVYRACYKAYLVQLHGICYLAVFLAASTGPAMTHWAPKLCTEQVRDSEKESGRVGEEEKKS